MKYNNCFIEWFIFHFGADSKYGTIELPLIMYNIFWGMQDAEHSHIIHAIAKKSFVLCWRRDFKAWTQMKCVKLIVIRPPSKLLSLTFDPYRWIYGDK